MKKRWKRLTALTLALLLVLSNAQWAIAKEANPDDTVTQEPAIEKQETPAPEEENTGKEPDVTEPAPQPAAQETEEPLKAQEPQPVTEYSVRIAAADTAAGKVYAQTTGEKHELALDTEYSETVGSGSAFALEVAPNSGFGIDTVKMDGNTIDPKEVKDGVSTYLIENISKDILIEIGYKTIQMQASEEIVQNEVTVKPEDSNDGNGEETKQTEETKKHEDDKAEAEEKPSTMSVRELKNTALAQAAAIPVTYSGLVGGVTGPETISSGYVKNTAPAIEGYRFLKATVNDTEITYVGIYDGQIYISGDGESAIQLKNDHEIVLTYKMDIPEYQVTYTYDKNKGSVKESNEKDAVDGVKDQGTKVSLTVKPEAGYGIKCVMLNGEMLNGTADVYEFTVMQECAVNVIFEEKDTFTVTRDISAIADKGLDQYLDVSNFPETGTVQRNSTWSVTFQTKHLNKNDKDEPETYINYVGVNGKSIPLYSKVPEEHGGEGGILWYNGTFTLDLGDGMTATLTRKVQGPEDNPVQQGGLPAEYTLTIENVIEDLNIQMNARARYHDSSELMLQSAEGVDVYYWDWNESKAEAEGQLRLLTPGTGAPSGKNHYLFIKTKPGFEPDVVKSGDKDGQPADFAAISTYENNTEIYQKGKAAALEAGCTYVGWFDWDMGGKHESGISLKAKPTEIKVIYDLDGGKGSIEDEKTYTIQEDHNIIPVTQVKPEKDVNLVFDGWQCDLSGDKVYFGGDIVRITEDNIDQINHNTVTFTALWAKAGEAKVQYRIEHWVESEENPGEYIEESDKSKTYQGVRDVTAYAIPSEEIIDRGYRLDTSVQGFQQAGVVTADGELVLKLYYSLESYSITYDLDNGRMEQGKENPASYRKTTETFTLHNPVRDGYVFDGWSGTGIALGDFSKEVAIKKGSTGDRAYTAHWKRAVTVRANNVQVVYGAAAEEIKAGCTATVTGLPDDVSQESLEIVYTIADEGAIKDAKTYEGAVQAEIKNAPEDWVITYSPGNVTVNPKKVQVTLHNQGKTYGAEDPELTYQVETPLPYSESEKELKITVSRDGAGQKEEVGAYNITGGYDNPNYEITFSGEAKLTIRQAALTVTAQPASKAYGDVNPDFTATVTGIIDNAVVQDTEKDVCSEITYACEAEENSPVGEYQITPGLKLTEHGEKNYTVSPVESTLTITQKETDIVITAQSSEISYGEAIPQEFEASVTGGEGTTLPNLAYTVELERDRNEVKDAGSYDIVVKVDPDQEKNYKITTVPGSLTIKPAELTVKMEDRSSTYGEPKMDLGYQVSGQQYEENPSDLVDVTNLRVVGDGAGVDHAGRYNITGDPALKQGALGSNGLYNYVIQEQPGTYTINRRPVTVTADRKKQVYGDPEKELTWTAEQAQAGVPGTGLLDGDELRGITAERIIREQNKGKVKVGWYDVKLSWDDERDPNYEVTLKDRDREYVIQQRQIILTVTPDKETTYGDKRPNFEASDKLAPNGAQDVSKGGILAGDKRGLTPSVTYSIDTCPSGYDPAGKYEITAGLGETAGWEGVMRNYRVMRYENATYTVNPRDISIEINAGAKVYNNRPGYQELTGDEKETLSFTTIQGAVVKGDKLVIGLKRAVGESVGDYPVSMDITDYWTERNYNVTPTNSENAKFTITPREVTGKITSQTKTYGSGDPDAKFEHNAIVEGDTLNYTITREAGENVRYKDADKETLGGYEYQLDWRENLNYRLGAIEKGTLTIEPFPFAIRAESNHKFYGEDDPVLKASLDPAFPNGFPQLDRGKAIEDIVTYSVTRESKKENPKFDDAGTYAINVNIEKCSDNYAPTREAGIFTINQRAGEGQTVVIDIGSYTKQYGDDDPAYEKGTIDGLLEVDRDTVEWEIVREDKGTDEGERVGANHPITAKITKNNPNYKIIVNDGNLEITKRTLTLTPEEQRVTYSSKPQQEDPAAWNVKATNLLSGDKLGEVVDYELKREAGADVRRNTDGSIGFYEITFDKAELKGEYAKNYTLATKPGKFYIEPMQVSLTAASDPMTYGELQGEPEFELSRAAGKEVPAELTGLRDKVARYNQEGVPMEGVPEGRNAGAYTLDLDDREILKDYTNYDITFQPGTFIITPKELTLTPKKLDITYGEPQTFELDENSYKTAYEESLNSIVDYEIACENDGSVTGSPYPITVEIRRQISGNYDIKTGTAELTIKKKPVTVKMDETGKVYGESDPELIPIIQGVEEGDELGITLERKPGTDVGNYEVSIKEQTGDAGNYDIQLEAPDFKITKRPVKLTANQGEKVYGDADPSGGLTATISGYEGNASSGLVNGDTLSYEVKRDAGEEVADNGYPVRVTALQSAEGFANKNYEIETTDNIFTITPAKLTVKANDASKVFGAADPEFAASVSGLKRGDKEKDVIDGVKVEREDKSEDAGDRYKLKVTSHNLKSKNYTVSLEDGKFTIFQKADGIQVSVGTASKTYGEQDPDWSGSELKKLVTVQGLEEGQKLYYSLKRMPGSAVGEYAIQVEIPQENNPNFDVSKIVVSEGTFTINKRPVTVAAKDNGKEYGGQEPALEAQVTGAAAIGNEGDEVTCSVARDPGEDVREGGYVITPTVTSENPNYEITAKTGLFTITPKHITVTTGAKDKIYGDKDPEFNITTPDGTPAPDDLGGTVEREPGETVGDYETTVKTDNKNYVVKVEPGKLTINPRELTMTIDDKEQVYGDAEERLTAAVEGFIEKDQDNADKLATYKLERVKGKDVGDYLISAKDLKVDNNYTLKPAVGNYKITPRAITLEQADLSKVYGDKDPDIQGSVKAPSVIAEKNLAPVVYQAKRSEGENVGAYQVGITLGENPNYAITVNPVEFRITPKPVTIVLNAASKIYGDADPAWSANVSGLVGEDTLNYEIKRQDGEDAGDYKLEVFPGENPNYTIGGGESTFTIQPAPLHVSADNKVMTYGGAEPELTAQVTGLKRGDKAEDVVKYELSREPGNGAGTYKIMPKINDSSKNYTVAASDGTLTITPKNVDVVVSADNMSKIYGEADPKLTANVSGLLEGDVLNYTVTREPGEDVRLKADGTFGGYPVHVDVQGNPNYNVQTVDGIFTILPKRITVTTDQEDKIYGDKDPDFNITTPDGTPAPDDLGGVVEREPGEDTGSYDVTVKVNNPNYTVDVITKEFEITPKDIVLSANNAEKVVGAQDPVLTVREIAGLVGDDTVDYTVSREAGEEAGTYAITPAVKGTYKNYNIKIENGVFTIRDTQQGGIPAPITPITPAPAGPAAPGQFTPAVTPGTVGTGLTPAPAAAPTVIDAQGNVLGTPDDYALSQLPEERVPLANQKLPQDHRCCILHFLLLLLALLLEVLYTRSMKKRQKRIQELEKELALIDASGEDKREEAA